MLMNEGSDATQGARVPFSHPEAAHVREIQENQHGGAEVEEIHLSPKTRSYGPLGGGDDL